MQSEEVFSRQDAKNAKESTMLSQPTDDRISHPASQPLGFLGVLGVLAREKMVFFDVAFVSGHAKKSPPIVPTSLTDMLCKWIKSSLEWAYFVVRRPLCSYPWCSQSTATPVQALQGAFDFRADVLRYPLLPPEIFKLVVA